MTSLSVVQKAHERLASDLAHEDWSAADRSIQYLAGAWLRASDAADPVELEKVATDVKKLRVKVVSKYDVDQTVGPMQIAWLLAGVSSVLSQAKRVERLSGFNTRSLILEALFLANGAMSTGDLARRIGRSTSTVARELPKLRKEKLVKSREAGSQMLNQITPEGRARHLELDQQDQAGVRTYPTTLSKRHARPVATLGIRQVAHELGRPTTVINAMASVPTALCD